MIKQVDSTLRGNVAAEIKALDEAYQSELVLFMPALPDLARTTVDGVHRLNGTPITETELARDPKKPVKEDHIGKILESVYQEPVTLVTLETIRTGTVDLTGGRLFACDAETNKDMQTVLQAAKALNKKILYVGTAAMADNLFEIDMPVKPSMATTLTRPRQDSPRAASQVLNTFLDRPGTTSSRRAGPLRSRTGVRPIMTVTYRSLRLVWRHTEGAPPARERSARGNRRRRGSPHHRRGQGCR